MAKSGGSDVLQVYLQGGEMTDLDGLTERVNTTLKAIFAAGARSWSTTSTSAATVWSCGWSTPSPDDHADPPAP
jgi:hypothetical protein